MNKSTNNKYFGFIGKLLKIDLSKESISFEDINHEYALNYLGGAGYACRYLFDQISRNTDPLSVDNIFMLMTGPFCLTSAPSSSRIVICAKSPYTKLWGEANSGGFFGAELKKAGFDGIIITGKAKNPVYIKIMNRDAEIIDATSLWGMGNKKVQKKLKELTGNIKAKMISIGPAGENLVKFSNINAEGRSAGRAGMGAVMGSKNLKAIVVKGDSFNPKIAYPEKFKQTVKKTLKYILNTNATKVLREYGTSAVVTAAHGNGDLPIKYWTQGEWEDVFDISGQNLKDNFIIKRKSCYGCSIGCGKLIELKNKDYIFSECEGPEYETIAGFGSMILNNNLESISIANNLCNDYGFDTISGSSAIALLYYLYNKGLIKKEDVDGLELDWGNHKSLLTLIQKIAFREGIGNILAEGSNAVGKHFNIPMEEIATINNLEAPYHDIRACYGLALTYAFGPRGACHITGDVFKVVRKENEVDFSSMGIKKLDMFSNNKKMAKYSALLHDYRAIYSSFISCFFMNPPPEYIAELISNLCGLDFDISKLKLIGERIFNLKRLFNIKMGLTSQNDQIPKILLEPTNEGAIKGKSPDFEKLKSYYYQFRDWDPITGKPNISKLKSLGLENLKI
ncbi:MAG: aldehyde ferredoxin oxidoreductase family protein [Candidatus Hermodarchaeota archaeon]